MPTFTTDQIHSLAPDAASLKAGKDLAQARKWPTLALNDRVVWGEVQGSGKDPYRTQADLQNLAFKCSCPSRKFPCKHGIGLLLLYAGEPALFKTSDEPAWVTEWMDKRQEKAQKAPADAPDSSPKTDLNKVGASEKRMTDRLDSIRAGNAELMRWLEDLMRAGLLTLPDKGAAYWNQLAARMVDAKAPGLAYRVKQLGNLPFYNGNAWHAQAVAQVGRLYLLCRAVDRLPQLPPDLANDVKAAVGLTINQKELLESPTAPVLTDGFWVLARQTTQEDDLTVQKTYLLGQESGRFAQVLQYAYKNTPIQTLLIPGTRTTATLVFYPGRLPYRAVLKTESLSHSPIGTALPEILPDWQTAQQRLTDVLSQSPWADDLPQVVGPLTLTTEGGRHVLVDADEASQPVHSEWPTDAYYTFLALGGGEPASVFLLRTVDAVYPLGLWTNDRYYPL